MDVRPLHDRIVVKLAAAESQSAGGIIIPEIAQEAPVFADVLSVGAGAILKGGARRPPAVAVGDRVLLKKRAGVECDLDGVKALVVSEDAILGVCEPQP
jgi:chaperonin GroES